MAFKSRTWTTAKNRQDWDQIPRRIVDGGLQVDITYLTVDSELKVRLKPRCTATTRSIDLLVHNLQ